MSAKCSLLNKCYIKDYIEEVVEEEKLKKNKLLALQNVTCSVSGFESKSKKKTTTVNRCACFSAEEIYFWYYISTMFLRILLRWIHR